MFIENYLELGLRPESIDFNYRGTNTICPVCGRAKYVYKPGYIFYDRKVFDKVDVDIVKSGENFGVETSCVREIFINQRLRQILIKNDLDKGFNYVPVKLV